LIRNQEIQAMVDEAVVRNPETLAEREIRNPEIRVLDFIPVRLESLCRGFLYSRRMKLLPIGA
jgi:hypothetical protein